MWCGCHSHHCDVEPPASSKRKVAVLIVVAVLVVVVLVVALVVVGVMPAVKTTSATSPSTSSLQLRPTSCYAALESRCHVSFSPAGVV